MRTVLLLHDAPHSPQLRVSLCELGYTVVADLDYPQTLHHEVQRHAPQVIIVITQAPDDRTLESLREVARSCPRPVVMFAQEGTRELIRKAVECGVGAYVVDGWSPARLAPIVEAATARFEAFEAIRRELASTRAKLSERKLV